jgi:hypothetical protein
MDPWRLAWSRGSSPRSVEGHLEPKRVTLESWRSPHQGVAEAHLEPWRLNWSHGGSPWTLGGSPHQGAAEAHQGAAEAHQGAAEAHPGAVEDHLTREPRGSPWSHEGSLWGLAC